MWFMSFELTGWTEWTAGSKYHFILILSFWKYCWFFLHLLTKSYIISEFKMSFPLNWYAVGNGLKYDVLGF